MTEDQDPDDGWGAKVVLPSGIDSISVSRRTLVYHNGVVYEMQPHAAVIQGTYNDEKTNNTMLLETLGN